MKIIKTITENKKQILITLFVGILLFYLGPILNIIGEKVIKTFLAFSEDFSNNYYSSLSTFSPNRFNRSIYSLVIIFSCGFLGYFIFYTSLKTKELHKSSDQFLAEIKLILEGPKQIDVEDNTAKLNKILNEEKEHKKDLVSLSRLKNVAITLFIITFLSVISEFLYVNVQYLMYKNFQNKVTIVAPYIANQEVLLFHSNFVLMENAEDYEQLMNDLNKNLEEFNLDI